MIDLACKLFAIAALAAAAAAIARVGAARWRVARARTFHATLAAIGPTALRARIDREHPAAAAIHHRNARVQRTRMAALALLGDTSAVDREVATHQGLLLDLAQVQTIGLLALALRGREPARAAVRMRALADRASRELAGALAADALPAILAYASLADALVGAAPPPISTAALERATRTEPLVRALVWESFTRVLRDPRAARFRRDLARMRGR
jgi:hypothetical protein